MWLLCAGLPASASYAVIVLCAGGPCHNQHCWQMYACCVLLAQALHSRQMFRTLARMHRLQPTSHQQKAANTHMIMLTPPPLLFPFKCGFPLESVYFILQNNQLSAFKGKPTFEVTGHLSPCMLLARHSGFPYRGAGLSVKTMPKKQSLVVSIRLDYLGLPDVPNRLLFVCRHSLSGLPCWAACKGEKQSTGGLERGAGASSCSYHCIWDGHRSRK